MCQEEGFKFNFDTRNNGALPLDPACPECLSVRSPADLPYNILNHSKSKWGRIEKDLPKQSMIGW
jgi:hypothetical protein